MKVTEMQKFTIFTQTKFKYVLLYICGMKGYIKKYLLLRELIHFVIQTRINYNPCNLKKIFITSPNKNCKLLPKTLQRKS